MYHTMINPTIYMDVDGQYKGLDQNVHKAEGFTNYTTFSLWDTYRGLHPLFNIIQPQRNADMIKVHAGALMTKARKRCYRYGVILRTRTGA
jgi:putative alpha-1,2-mannosidase